MIENIQTSTATTPVMGSDATSKDPQGGRSLPPAVTSASAQNADNPPPAEQSTSPTRLLIDQDKVTGVFVYRIVDSQTGALLAEIPNDQIANLKNAGDYVSGSVISTSA
ncbi:MAG: hypothetical protein WA840_23525 [Caulobacteraceae bacterium]